MEPRGGRNSVDEFISQPPVCDCGSVGCTPGAVYLPIGPHANDSRAHRSHANDNGAHRSHANDSGAHRSHASVLSNKMYGTGGMTGMLTSKVWRRVT